MRAVEFLNKWLIRNAGARVNCIKLNRVSVRAVTGTRALFLFLRPRRFSEASRAKYTG